MIPIAEITIPAIANPFPFNLPQLLLIFTRLIIPQTIAGSEVTKKENSPIIPSTNAQIASVLVFANGGGSSWITGSSVEHEIQTFSSTGFSIPQFGQYTIILLKRKPHSKT